MARLVVFDTNLLIIIPEKLAEIGQTNLIEARVYLSRGWDEGTARKIMMKEMLAEQQDRVLTSSTFSRSKYREVQKLSRRVFDIF